jgi:hypothetical protein
MNDPEAQKLLQEGEQDFDFNTEAACFTVDVMTKLDRF